ncbi:MAG TPA: hypothetical protein VK178_16810 [Opitutaceae bacterium]|nr:hypothetical protein [Opitutaceae bacterium]
MKSCSRLLALGALLPALLLAKPDSGASAHYQTVRERVGDGGQVFVYVDVDGYFTQLGRDLTTDIASVAGDEPALARWKQDYAAIAAELGLAQVQAVGLSSRQLGPDRFANKIYLHVPEGRRGLLRLLGGGAHPFTTAKLAPADADLFVETEFDLAALYTTAHQLLQRFDPELAKEFPGAELVDPAHPAGAALAAFLKAQGRFTAIVRLHGETALSPEFEFKHDILFALDVCGPQLLALLREQHPELKESKTESGKTFYTLGEAGAGLPLQPVVAVDGNAFYFATSAGFLRECLDRKSGLPQAPIFKEALAATAAEGNAIAYASPRLFASLGGLLKSIPQLPGADKSFEVALQGLLKRFAKVGAPAVSVTSNLPEGVLVQSVGPSSLRESLPALGLATPDLAGNILRVVLPAHVASLQARALATRQESAIRENLAKVSAAAEGFFATNAEAEEVSFTQLLESAPTLAQLASVAGEDYASVTVRRDHDTVEIMAPNGVSATYGRALTDAERAKIAGNLALFDEAAVLYFVAHPDESTMSAYAATEAGGALTSTPDSVVGEQYEIEVARDATAIELRTPGGSTVRHERQPGLRWTLLKRRAQQTAAIRENLATFHAVASEYLAAHPDESYVSGYELFGGDHDRPELPAVAGESYSQVRLNRNSATVSFEVPGVGTVVYEAELPAAQAEAIRKNLRAIAKAGADFFTKNPAEKLIVAGELFAAGAARPEPVVGEDYEALVLERGASSLAITSRDGRKIAAELR